MEYAVDLFVRSWVEILPVYGTEGSRDCRPLREVVSWNIQRESGRKTKRSRPLREVVSWNRRGIVSEACPIVDLFVRSWVEISCHIAYLMEQSCRPLREVVSWNVCGCSLGAQPKLVDLFVRSWVEISHPPLWEILHQTVDLFVRSWVEMSSLKQSLLCVSCVDLFVRSWVEILLPYAHPVHLRVDLFVRSWVEMYVYKKLQAQESGSTSSWGRELKFKPTAILYSSY